MAHPVIGRATPASAGMRMAQPGYLQFQYAAAKFSRQDPSAKYFFCGVQPQLWTGRKPLRGKHFPALLASTSAMTSGVQQQRKSGYNSGKWQGTLAMASALSNSHPT